MTAFKVTALAMGKSESSLDVHKATRNDRDAQSDEGSVIDHTSTSSINGALKLHHSVFCGLCAWSPNASSSSFHVHNVVAL